MYSSSRGSCTIQAPRGFFACCCRIHAASSGVTPSILPRNTGVRVYNFFAGSSALVLWACGRRTVVVVGTPGLLSRIVATLFGTLLSCQWSSPRSTSAALSWGWQGHRTRHQARVVSTARSVLRSRTARYLRARAQALQGYNRAWSFFSSSRTVIVT
jgi:hypothetical protein